MNTLCNNRGNASQYGLWYVNANNAPSNANADNWGSRQSPQRRKTPRNCFIVLNHPPIQSAFGFIRKECAGQSPLIRRGQVATSKDDGRKNAMRKRRRAAA